MIKLTTGQVARLLQVSSQTVLRLIRSGELRGERLTATGQYRITKDELARYAQDRSLTLLPDQDEK